MARRPRGIGDGGRHVRRNRRFWEANSAEYDRRFEKVLGGSSAMSWGLWRVPERRLRLLDPVGGRTVLEVGCGGARWSAALARRGAAAIGLDISLAQLRVAAEVTRKARAPVRLIRGSAERIPLGDATIDQAFCDWGALTFTDPYKSIPECARVLRPGGALVFATGSPLRYIAHDRRRDAQVRRLTRPYFGLRELVFDDTTDFQIPYGDWITLFGDHGLSVERLIETRPPTGSGSRYLSASDTAWGRRWPMECLWKVRKVGAEPRRRPAKGAR